MSLLERSSPGAQESRPRVSVILPNFNGIQHLPECLACLYAQTYDDFEVVMVDNASTDESVCWVQEHYPAVRIVQRTVNGGPVKSTNDGILASRGEYIVILDNDTAFDQEWLRTLVKAMDDRPGYGIGIAKMLVYEEDDRLLSAGAVYSIARLSHRDRGTGLHSSDYPQMQRVLIAGGNGVIHRRDVFTDVGLYDEDYYAMYEDIDFSLRCLLKDKRCLYIPETYVRHKVGLCRQVSVSYEAEMAWTRNGAMMAAKTLPIPLLVVGLLALGWQEFRETVPLRPSYYRSFPELLRRSRGRAKARWEGLRKGWSKRRPIWESRTNSRREIYRWLLRGEGPV